MPVNVFWDATLCQCGRLNHGFLILFMEHGFVRKQIFLGEICLFTTDLKSSLLQVELNLWRVRTVLFFQLQLVWNESLCAVTVFWSCWSGSHSFPHSPCPCLCLWCGMLTLLPCMWRIRTITPELGVIWLKGTNGRHVTFYGNYSFYCYIFSQVPLFFLKDYCWLIQN